MSIYDDLMVALAPHRDNMAEIAIEQEYLRIEAAEEVDDDYEV